MESKAKKVFISYSWAVTDRVMELASRLRRDCIDVILDKWDLKEGQDKYAFMEKSVNDQSIEKVLVICDRTYAEKANARTGGVGDETLIISPEVYANVNQEKFLPVIFEVDDTGAPYIPAYIKSRIYFDLSSDDKYETGYEGILRNLHEKPLYSKPPLGRIPSWLESENVDFSYIRSIIRQIEGPSSQAKREYVVRCAIDAFTESVMQLSDENMDGKMLIQAIEKSLHLRNFFLDFIGSIIRVGMPVGLVLGTIFDGIQSLLFSKQSNQNDNEYVRDFYGFFIWEMFIVSVATLLYYQLYDDIAKILTQTYFMRKHLSGDEVACNFNGFNNHLRTIEEVCKLTCGNPNLFSLSSEMLVKREREPILSKTSIAETDVFLYQVHCMLYPPQNLFDWPWFPRSYVYANRARTIWPRLVSRRFCQNVLCLFGVDSVESMITKISGWKETRNVQYDRCFSSPLSIRDCIKVDEIASMP
jgi:hypothetical protein